MKPRPLNSLGTQKLGTCYITVTKGSSQRPSRAQSHSVLNLPLRAWSYVQYAVKKISRSAEQMHVGTEQRSDTSKRWFMLSQNRPVNHSIAFLYSSSGAPSTRQRTDCSSTQPPHPLEKVFFFFSGGFNCCVVSRAEPSPIMPKE